MGEMGQTSDLWVLPGKGLCGQACLVWGPLAALGWFNALRTLALEPRRAGRGLFAPEAGHRVTDSASLFRKEAEIRVRLYV